MIFFLLLLYNFLSFPNYNQKKTGQGGRSEPVIISNWVEVREFMLKTSCIPPLSGPGCEHSIAPLT